MVEPSLALALFSTPVVAFDLPEMDDVNHALAAELLAEERAAPSWQRANVGGWHSVPDLSRRAEPHTRALMRAIVDHVARHVAALAADAGAEQLPAFRYGVTAWAMILRRGDYVVPHDHGDAHWSVAYYVDAGDDLPAPSGHLAFLDPRRGGRPIPELTLFPSTFDLAPRTGALVIFPAWLVHYVHAYRGDRPRICISANLTMEAAAPAGRP
ncbi:MAG TPA: TIGR02466 family protein [Kofleriaceae bacterium]|nr:TIGR02466 family protein [Kofleriaceae bacterium]